MKKYLLLVILFVSIIAITGCDLFNKDKHEIRADANYEELFDVMIQSLKEDNVNKYVKVFPNFMEEKAKELFDIFINNVKNVGEEYDISFDLKNDGRTDEAGLSEVNQYINNELNNPINVTQCQDILVTLNLKGSKYESIDEIGTFRYCNFNNYWRLFFK